MSLDLRYLLRNEPLSTVLFPFSVLLLGSEMNCTSILLSAWCLRHSCRFSQAVLGDWSINCRRGGFCGIAEEESEFASFRDGVILLRLGDQQLPSRPLLYKHCARETMQAKPRQVCLLIKQNKMNDAASVSNMSIFLTGYSHDLTLGWNLIILCGWGRETVLALHVQLEQCRRDLSLLTLHVGEIKR